MCVAVCCHPSVLENCIMPLLDMLLIFLQDVHLVCGTVRFKSSVARHWIVTAKCQDLVFIFVVVVFFFNDYNAGNKLHSSSFIKSSFYYLTRNCGGFRLGHLSC